ncbi:MAG TPA: hypothetical protein VG961_01410 [Ignavibacteria bacterium]|nr:hypothetical protein [Ignavibacteria bacterium]
MISLFISLVLLFTAGTESAGLRSVNITPRDTCRTIEDADRLKNSEAVIIGRLQKFTPWESGKGAGHMFWQWEILFPGGGRIPVVNKNKSDGESIVFDEYESRNVIIYGTVYHGIVIGDSNPEHQSMTGFRIDADGIDIAVTAAAQDTCWVYADVEAHANMDCIVAGKITEYQAPYDGSKLGEEKIWDYRLVTQDNYRIPIRKDKYLNLEKFKDKDVFINGYVKYGIIFGEPNTANMQGYRIDVFEVSLNEKGYGNTLIEGKIRLDLTKFNEEGYRVHPDGEKSATSYEFCIPADETLLAEVKAIDQLAGEMKGSKGRSGCTDSEWLVISSTRKAGFKEIIRKLAELKYIRKIMETFWE